MAEQKDSRPFPVTADKPLARPQAEPARQNLQPPAINQAAPPVASILGADMGEVDPKMLTKEQRKEAFQMGIDSRAYVQVLREGNLARARKNMPEEKPSAEDREKATESQEKRAASSEKEHEAAKRAQDAR